MEFDQNFTDANNEFEASFSLHNTLTNSLENLDTLIPSNGGCSIILWNSDTATFEISGSTVPNQPQGTMERRIRTTGGATRWIVDNQQALIVQDTDHDPFGANSMIIEYGIQSYLGVPLIVNDTVIGVLYALSTDKNTYQQFETQLLQNFAVFIAMAVHNAQMNKKLIELSTLVVQGHKELQAIFDTIPDNIYMKDIHGYFTKVNKRSTEFYRVNNHNEVIGKTDFDFFPQPLAEAFKKDDRYILETGKAIHNKEFAIHRTDEQTEWILVNKVALRDENQNIIGILGSSRFITDRKIAEQQYHDLVVKQQSIEILQKIIADVGHDFKTPLSIINTSLFILKQQHSELSSLQLDNIQKQSKRLLQLVENMQESARIEQSKTFTFSSKNIVTIVRNIVVDFSETATRNEQTLSLVAPKMPIILPIVVKEFTLAIRHLIDNALIHNPANTEITVTIEKFEEKTLITVKDSGIGISESDLPYIFEPFYRVDTSRNSDTGGTGLGLSIVQKIITLHQGYINVSSEPNFGTQFQIFLP